MSPEVDRASSLCRACPPAKRAAGRRQPQIRIGVGIATGEMVAGCTGTNERATYTCIGDTVNLASRLKTHTKEADRMILIDSTTRSDLRDDTPLDSIGPVAIRGKTQPVDVFALRATPSASR